MRAKERLQFYTSAMSFTSAVLLSDEGLRKNNKVGKRHDFRTFWAISSIRKLSLVSENNKVRKIVATTTFQYFHRIC